ncbi:MAG: PAS domain S-box protein [Desulfobacteraceae bacterium]|nr:PAS domain S-box protein [Desulfobacteraceae bacterium]
MTSEKQICALEEKVEALERELAGEHELKNHLQAMVDHLGSRNEYLLTLHDLCTGLINRSDHGDLLKNIVQHACTLVGVSNGFMHFFDPITRELEFKIGTGYFEKALGFRLMLGAGMGGVAFSSQEPFVVKDYRKWEGRIEADIFKDLRACVIIPLENHAGTIGLGRFGEDTTQFSQTEVEVLKRFSQMASICIENAKIYSDLQEELRQRQRAEKSLLLSERDFEAIFELVGEGFYRTDDQGGIIMANPVAIKMLGYDSLEESLGISMLDLYSNPDDRAKALDLLFKEGRLSAYEVEMKKKDGQIISVLINSHVRHNDIGEFIGIQGTVVDITHRKYLETEQIHSQKLAAIGSLAAGIAHEINTPVQYVSDNTSFIQESFNDLNCVWDATGRLLEVIKKKEGIDSTMDAAKILADALEKADLDYLKEEIPLAIEQSLDGLAKIARIVLSMKEFSHPGGDAWELTDINHTLDNTIIVAKNEWKYVANIKRDFQTSIPLVNCNPGELSQVFLNMIINASHAIGAILDKNCQDKGTITVGTRIRGAWLEIKISDTGDGIPKEIQTHIFDPFFTTKEVGRGTGQGLAISHSVVVEKHKGKISFQTSQGCGTTFIIQLPVNGLEKNSGDLK